MNSLTQVNFRTRLFNINALNQNGQGLIEYLIIVALMGVATIAIVRVMGEVVSNRFAAVSGALQGDKIKNKPVKIEAANYKRKDLGDFMRGTTAKEKDISTEKNSGENE